jgi:hypothetical protein
MTRVGSNICPMNSMDKTGIVIVGDEATFDADSDTGYRYFSCGIRLLQNHSVGAPSSHEKFKMNVLVFTSMMIDVIDIDFLVHILWYWEESLHKRIASLVPLP